ncbi:MAG: hypothetical protein EZS28_052764, partial [Streblomastix strix]
DFSLQAFSSQTGIDLLNSNSSSNVNSIFQQQLIAQNQQISPVKLTVPKPIYQENLPNNIQSPTETLEASNTEKTTLKKKEQNQGIFSSASQVVIEQIEKQNDEQQDTVADEDEFFWVVSNYNGQEDDDDFLPVAKGELVRVIKKEAQWFYIEKDGEIGKIPQQFLRGSNLDQTQQQVQVQVKADLEQKNKTTSSNSAAALKDFSL